MNVHPPDSDSGLNSVLISACWTPKPIITVFCQKLAAHQKGGGGRGSARPSLSHLHGPRVTAALLWRGVSAPTRFACERCAGSGASFQRDDVREVMLGKELMCCVRTQEEGLGS